MNRRTAAWLAAGLCVGTLGCSKKIEECNALIQQLNESSTAVQAQTTGLVTSPKTAAETLAKLAEATKAETGKIAAVPLSEEKLVGFSKEYQSMLDQLLQSATAMSKAAGAMVEVQASISKDRDSWMASTTKLRVACIKARKVCKELGETLTRPPMVSGIRPAEDAKKLDEYAKAIGEVAVDNADVKAAVDEVKKNLASFATTLRKADAAAKSVESATSDLKATADKEPALIKNINGFCQGTE